MGVPLTELISYDASVPGIDDGEPANHAVLTAPLQALANRSAYQRDLTEVRGVTRLRTVADTATLRTYAGQQDGDVIATATGTLFRFRAVTPAPAEAFPLHIVSGVGPSGVWDLLGAGYGIVGIAGGIAPLDANAKLPPERLPPLVPLRDATTNRLPLDAVPQGIVGSYYATRSSSTEQYITNSNTLVSNLALTLPNLQAGDLVHLDASIYLQVSNWTDTASSLWVFLAIGYYQIAVAVIDPPTNGALSGRTVSITGARFTAGGGTATVNVQIYQNPLGATTTIKAMAQANFIRALVIRP